MIPRRDKLYLKVVNTGWKGTSCTGPFSAFNYADYLPIDNKPGKWTLEAKPEMCVSGWHVTDPSNIGHWKSYTAQDVYIVEVRGRGKFGHDKAVFPQMRFIYRTRIGRWRRYTLTEYDLIARHINRAYKKARHILREERNNV